MSGGPQGHSLWRCRIRASAQRVRSRSREQACGVPELGHCGRADPVRVGQGTRSCGHGDVGFVGHILQRDRLPLCGGHFRLA
jgi:hypothetical protein